MATAIRIYWLTSEMHYSIRWVTTDIRFFRRLTFRAARPICSWLVAAAYAEIGLLFGTGPRYLQPDGLLDYCVREDFPLLWASSQRGLDQFRRSYLHLVVKSTTRRAVDQAETHEGYNSP